MHIQVFKTNCRERFKNIINLINLKTKKYDLTELIFSIKSLNPLFKIRLYKLSDRRMTIDYSILVFKRPNLLPVEDSYRKRMPIDHQISYSYEVSCFLLKIAMGLTNIPFLSRYLFRLYFRNILKKIQ